MEFVSKGLVTVSTSQGQFQLEDISELKISASNGMQAVKTMNKADKVRGHRGGNREITATWTVQNALVKDLNLFRLWRTRERFLMEVQEGPGDGDRYQLVGVVLDEFGPSYGAEGESTIDISLVVEDIEEAP